VDECAILCKSYRPDLERCAELVESVRRHDRDGLPFYLCLPASDQARFANRLGTDGIRFVSDEEVLGRAVAQSWRSQQLVKLGFASLGVCKNYVWLDSDFLVLRDFGVDEFFAYPGVPYTVLFEARPDAFRERLLGEAALDSEYLQTMAGVTAAYARVRDEFGRRGPLFFYGAPAIWSCRVVDALEQRMKAQGSSFEGMLARAPFELSWYGEFLLASQLVPVVPRGSMAVYFARDTEYARFVESGLTLQALAARGYWAVNFAAKWMSRHPIDSVGGR
jgi:hypothetical protein